MTRSFSRIDPDARQLLSSIAGTREGQVSAMALAYKHTAGKQLIDAGLLVERGSTRTVLAADKLDDTPTILTVHPITGREGHLGTEAWQDERSSTWRRVYSLDMISIGRRVVAQLDCSLHTNPVPYLDGAVLDYGSARLPKRRKRVGLWIARGLSSPLTFNQLRHLAEKRPSEGLRLVICLDPLDQHRAHFAHFIVGHEFIALADVVDHEDGIAVAPGILTARLLTGPAHKGPVWVSGDGGLLIVHGKMHEFTGSKQKMAVAMLAQAWLSGNPVIPVARILEEAECAPSVRRLRDLFSGHPTWHEVIRESGSSCWLEV